MAETSYRGRRAVQIENDAVRVTVTVEGGHIAEVLHKASGVNPLWTPPWPSIEPSQYNAANDTTYGGNSESRLLSGIMGHNTCIGIFGGPSEAEAKAGVTVHGEASVLPYAISADAQTMTCTCEMPMSRMRFTRTLRLDGNDVQIHERIESLSEWDMPIAWTQHATLGPPFLERGRTRFEATAAKSRTYEGDFGNLFAAGEDFDWPHAPLKSGGVYDLRVFTDWPVSAGYTAHLMDPARDGAEWTATDGNVTFGYRWAREDFPWLGIWEENHFRESAPWNGNTLTRGMEFGASPQPESRRAMIERGSMFGVPAYKWLPALGSLEASYVAFIR